LFFVLIFHMLINDENIAKVLTLIVTCTMLPKK